MATKLEKRIDEVQGQLEAKAEELLGQVSEHLDNPPPPPLTLWQKIAKAMELVGYVQKRGKNAAQNYTFATATDIAEKAREAFTDVGLLLLPTVKKIDIRQTPTKSGGLFTVSQATIEYTVQDVDSPNRYVFTMVGEGGDAGDKAVQKSLTFAFKYAILQLLMVSTGDDPEADERTDRDPPIVPPISADQVVILESLIDTHGANLEKMLNFFSVTKLTEMTAAQFERACALIEKRK